MTHICTLIYTPLIKRIGGVKMSDKERRSMPLFSIGIVMELTDLTARQIRYYEENDLVKPARTQGNRRLFSFNDVDRLLEIKELIEKGVNLAGIKQLFALNEKEKINPIIYEEIPEQKDLSEKELRELLKQELLHANRHKASLRQGELSRFFH